MTLIYTARRKRRTAEIDSFNTAGGVCYRTTGRTNGTIMVSHDYYQSWQAQETAREFLNGATWTDVFVKCPTKKIRHPKY